ncbi:GIY-YIG nuclease family protein [Mycoplasmopsis opalescens]|uniref:GIY-YIG nuclease family protein n=1 Tax=Mycoplasmopsis opalescens TaxID=114886 RepID=UPI0006917649|nr:GIY-YIG nuclease family protein [Mycoplasmopsis opalescens]
MKTELNNTLTNNINFKEKLDNLPHTPGVYLWKNKANEVIYIGKAKNLFNRMRQYFQGRSNSYKTGKLVENIYDFDIYLCRNDKEAYLLEKQLIEKFNPEYNILLLDDKKYPYIKIELFNNKLSITLTRKVSKSNGDKITYYGPFAHGFGAKTILKLLEREAYYENGFKIVNNSSAFWLKQYEKIKKILRFDDALLANFEKKMFLASENLNFEIALEYKNVLAFVKKMQESQVVELQNYSNTDVLAYKTIDNIIYITMLFYRNGHLINRINEHVELILDERQSLELFLTQFYVNRPQPDNFIMNDISLEFNIFNAETKIIDAAKGKYKKILDLANQNLDYFINASKTQSNNKLQIGYENCENLAKLISIEKAYRIAILDNSNQNNTNVVGVACIFENGLPSKNKYRKYNHNDQLIMGDYASMKLTAHKYFTSEHTDKNLDLIIADGSIIQIHAIKDVLARLNIKIPVVGLVKDFNHKTRTLLDLNEKEVFNIPKNIWNFLTFMQVEVDRFAKVYHRKRNKISSLEGKLLSIKGLGKKMELKLLNKFISYNNIYNASLEELMGVVPEKIALKIFNKEFLKEE